MKKTQTQRGNVLFLILIAVVLFAALSYAVTQSSRGGGDNVDDEKMRLEAARLLQQGAMIQQEFMKRRVFGEPFGVAQFNDDPGGIYEPGEGITLEFPPDVMVINNTIPAILNQFAWSYGSARIIINGVDAGTSAEDDFLEVLLLSAEACSAINNLIHGDPSIPIYSYGGIPQLNKLVRVSRDPVGFFLSPRNTELNITNIPICSSLGVNHYYVDIVNEN